MLYACEHLCFPKVKQHPKYMDHTICMESQLGIVLQNNYGETTIKFFNTLHGHLILSNMPALFSVVMVNLLLENLLVEK